jgi:NAD-dependent DNA ligase
MAYEPKPGDSFASRSKAQHKIEQAMFTKAAQTLIGICSGITADGTVHDREISFLQTWIKENDQVVNSWPGNVISQRIQAIMADGVITPEERADLLDMLQQITGNHFADTGAAATEGPALPIDDDPSIFFRNMSFCFTGRFIYGSRPACERAILGLGGTAIDHISGKLDYLVIGTMIEPQWINTSYGRKIEKAVNLQADGSDIVIVSERQWTAALADTGAQ